MSFHADWEYVQRKKSETGQSGTVTYDLPKKGVIPELLVVAFSTPTATTNPALSLVDAITKIEIVDGSTEIKSLTGGQIMGLSMIHGEKELAMTSSDDNAVEGYEGFRIHLGKVINGKHYAPDMARFFNPQIKITWDYSITTTVHGMTTDADSTPSMKFTVLAKIARDPSKFIAGYVKSSDIDTFVSAASAVQQVEVPRRDMLLGIGIEAGYDAKDWTEDVEEIKIDFDNGQFVPIHLFEEEIAPIMGDWFDGQFAVTFRKDVMDAIEVDMHMGFLTSLSDKALEDVFHVSSFVTTTKGVETYNLGETSDAVAVTAYTQRNFGVRGFIPFHIWYVPASEMTKDGSDLIDTKQFGRIIVEITQGASVDTSSQPVVLAEYLILQ